MALYVSLTIWLSILTILGLRPDSRLAAEAWPEKPQQRLTYNNQKICNFLAFITMSVLWFLTAFRSANIGNDTNTYIYYFQIFANTGVDRSRTFEIGYQILNVIIGKISSYPHMFLIIMATIMYASTMIYIFKFSKNVLISACLFYCLIFPLYTSMFRQGIAMIIVLYGYQALKNNKKWLSAFLFLLATSFHTTAVVSFLLFLNSSFFKKKWIMVIITFALTIVSAFGLINTVVVKLVPRYAHYFTSQYASSGWLAVSYSLIRDLIFYWLVCLSSNEETREDRLTVTNFAFLMLFDALGYSMNLFTRAGEYFLLIAITELPNSLYNGKLKHYRLWFLIICAVMLLMFILILIYRPGWNHLYPYELWK